MLKRITFFLFIQVTLLAVLFNYSQSFSAAQYEQTALKQSEQVQVMPAPNPRSLDEEEGEGDVLIYMPLIFGGPVSSAACETRGTWLNIDAFDTAQDRTETLSKIQRANLNTAFVLAPLIDTPNGSGQDGPPTDSSTHENFLAFIQLAHQAGISVHIWIPSRFRKVRANGNSKVNFTDPDEHQAQADWVLALMDKYGAYSAGIHFDYIRYDNWEIINRRAKMDGVTNTLATVYAQLKAKYPAKRLTTTSFSMTPGWVEEYESPPRWDRYADDVPHWFQDWYEAHPGNIYEGTIDDDSGNQYIGAPVYMKYQQNPVGWLQEGIVDMVIPMQYTSNLGVWNEEADHWKSFIESIGSTPDKLAMGLGWLRSENRDDGWDWNPTALVDHIQHGRSIGLKNFVIFEIGATVRNGLTDQDLIDALTTGNEAPFNTPIQSCLSN